MGNLPSKLRRRHRRFRRIHRNCPTPQAQAFKETMGMLLLGLQNPDVLAIRLYSADLISTSTRNEVLVSSLSNDRKNIILLQAVEAQIQVSPKRLDDFIAILSSEPAMSTLAELLKATYLDLVQRHGHRQSVSTVSPSNETKCKSTPAVTKTQCTTPHDEVHFPAVSGSKTKHADRRTSRTFVSSMPKHDTLPTQVTKYADYLQSVYESRPLPVDNKWPPSPSKMYINLATIRKEDVDQAEADEFTRATLHGNIDQIMKKKDAITMEDVLIEDEKCKCVLVEGAPGVGKSTFVWEFCRNWKRLSALRKFCIVQLVQLRDPTIQKAKYPTDLFYHDDPSISQAVREEIMRSGGRNVLLVLDGFDELPPILRKLESVFMRIINGLALPNATLIITSRPSASWFLLTFARVQITKHIEILGFLPAQITEYAKSIFTEADEFLHYIFSNPVIHGMMYIPLNCVIVAEIYRENRVANKPVPNTLTQLYTELSRALLRRYMVDKGMVSITYNMPDKFEDLPKDVYRQLLSLCELAFRGICNQQQLTFSQIDLPAGFDHLGFMNKAKNVYISKGVPASLNFLHLTLQEYLAAFHISMLLPDEQAVLFRESHSEENFKVAWLFVAGMTRLETIDLKKLFIDAVIGEESENSTYGSTQQNEFELDNSFITNCLYESQDSRACKNIFSQIGKVLVYNPARTATPFDLFTAGYCITQSEAVWKVFTSNASIGVEELSMFVAGLNSIPDPTGHVDILSIAFNQLGCHVANQLAHLNPKILQRISTLLLSHCELDVNACDALTSVILLMSELQSLDISSNPIHDGGARKLLQAMTRSEHLSVLDLTDTHLGPKDLEDLAGLIKPNRLLKSLKIGDENMTDECTKKMIKTTLAGSSLKHLEIYEAELDCATSELQHFLEGNNNLLSFQLCPCSSKVAVSVAKALHRNTTLKILRLGNISEQFFAEIRLEGAQALSQMLQTNCALEQLTVFDATIGRDGALTLIRAVQHSETLKTLKLPEMFKIVSLAELHNTIDSQRIKFVVAFSQEDEDTV